MKKAITILAVLIVLVGAVFAEEETHSIKLKTVVDPQLPVFQLVNTSVTGKNSDGTTTNIGKPLATTTNDSAKEFAAGGPYEVSEQDAVLVGDISRYDVAASFDVVLVNKAKIVKVFTLEFEAGAFETKVIENGQQVDHDVEAKTHALNDSVEGAVDDGVTTEIVDDDSFTADFNGVTCNQDGNTTVLATYDVTYEADPEVIPGTYYADITLTITADLS